MRQTFKVLVYCGAQYQHAYVGAESMQQAMRSAAKRMGRPVTDVEPLWSVDGKSPDWQADKDE